MKKILFLILINFLSVQAFAQTTKTYYTCVMHPEIQADKPGKCPKCGMDLYKKTVTVKKPNLPKTQATKKDTMPIKVVPKKDSILLPANDAKHKHDMGNMKMPVIKGNAVQTAVVSEPPKTVRYDLYVTDTIVNFTGKNKPAIAVNGQIPMPTLTFTEGDTAEIYVHNKIKDETSLHWHGLFLPNKEDGVPYLTQMPIKPNETYVYKFPIIQNGTHWYHSHSGLQEQIGMYGAMILNKRSNNPFFRKGIDDLPTIPMVLSEWADIKPKQIDRYLHNASDWFAIKKGTTQSYAEAIENGHLKTKLANEWKRMSAMDVSDVAYDRFLINGKNQHQLPQFRAGDRVRLRIANGGASSYFWLTYAGGKITVVANDGNDVEPVDVDRLIIAVSETYDVIVTIPYNMAFEFLVTPEDRTKSASLWLGTGLKVSAQRLPTLKYFAGMKMMNDMMKMNGNLNPKSMGGMPMANQKMDMNTVMYPEITGLEKKKNHTNTGDMHNMENESNDIVTLNYSMLRATHNTTLPKGQLRKLNFTLTGNMNRYVWALDNKTLSETDKILIKKGENLRIVLYNNSMMRHPMHLHGHDFRVLNGQGNYAPLKNVLDIMPMETDTIEFAANASGDWFFHCHILYHMMSGMGRVFSYKDKDTLNNPVFANPKKVQRKLYADDKMFHFMAENDFATNGNDGAMMLQNTRWSIGAEWRLGYNRMHGYETETHIGRYIGKMQWLMPFIGFDWRYRKMGLNIHEKNIFAQTNKKDNRAAVSIGFNYTLPMLMIFKTEVFHDGIVRLQLMREDIPVGKKIRAGFMVNTDKEYMFELGYIVNRFMRVRAHYDSDMELGAGLTFNY